MECIEQIGTREVNLPPELAVGLPTNNHEGALTMTSTNTSTVLDSISTFFQEADLPETMTAYKLSKVVNEVLSAVEIKNIPPQMCYNYVSKGLIPSVVVEDQKLVTKADAEAWVTKYVTKKFS